MSNSRPTIPPQHRSVGQAAPTTSVDNALWLLELIGDRQALRVAEAADVFLERGAFSAEQAERYLRAAAGHGLALRIHGDQFTESGAIPLAVGLGAVALGRTIGVHA